VNVAVDSCCVSQFIVADLSVGQWWRVVAQETVLVHTVNNKETFVHKHTSRHCNHDKLLDGNTALLRYHPVAGPRTTERPLPKQSEITFRPERTPWSADLVAALPSDPEINELARPTRRRDGHYTQMVWSFKYYTQGSSYYVSDFIHDTWMEWIRPWWFIYIFILNNLSKISSSANVTSSNGLGGFCVGNSANTSSGWYIYVAKTQEIHLMRIKWTPLLLGMFRRHPSSSD